MLAVNQNEQRPIQQKPSLKAVDLGTTQLPKGLMLIKTMLGDKRYKPEFIYDSVLNKHQRAVLCYAAKLSRSDINKPFSELTEMQRLDIQKAVLMMDKIYCAFNKVNAISPAKFIQGAMTDTPSIKGVG